MRLLSKLLRPVNEKRLAARKRNATPHQSTRERQRRLRQISNGQLWLTNGATESALAAGLLQDVA